MEPREPELRRVNRGFLDRLLGEVTEWQNRGIITPDQGQAIIAVYPEAELSQTPRGRLVTVLAILGAVLIGLGIIMFFASNWQELPREAKLALMLFGVPGTYVLGFWLRYRKNYQRVGLAVIFLAAIFYGAAIHLVAQSYHVPVNNPNLVSFWFLGVLPLAYVTRSQAMLFLSVVLFLTAAGFWVQVWLDDLDLIPVKIFPLYLIFGLMIYGLARLHDQFEWTKPLARVPEILGVAVAFGSLFLLTFQFWWDGWFGYFNRSEDVSSSFWLTLFIVTAVTVLAFFGASVIQERIGLQRATSYYESAAALVLLVVAYLVILLPIQGDILYPLLLNFLLFLGILGLIFLGYRRSDEAVINLALAFFVVDVFSRYFEFGFDLMDRS
ncbi:MAG: DUF2157 domain-containing protein, partial [Dehalococcoidia bacterium]